jgi:hypothetical protein
MMNVEEEVEKREREREKSEWLSRGDCVGGWVGGFELDGIEVVV